MVCLFCGFFNICVSLPVPGLSGGAQTRAAQTPAEPEDAVRRSFTDTGGQYLDRTVSRAQLWLSHSHRNTCQRQTVSGLYNNLYVCIMQIPPASLPDLFFFSAWLSDRAWNTQTLNNYNINTWWYLSNSKFVCVFTQVWYCLKTLREQMAAKNKVGLSWAVHHC